MNVLPSSPKSVMVVDFGENSRSVRRAINESILKVEQENRDAEAKSHGYKDEADMVATRAKERSFSGEVTKSGKHPARAYIREVAKRNVVQACGHETDPQRTPRRGCQHCWFAYFFSNPVQVAAAKQTFDTTELTDAEKKTTITASLGDKGFKFLKEFISQLNAYEAQRQLNAAQAEVASIMGKEQVVDLTEASNG